MIIARLFDDWKRYNIQNCEYERPTAFRVSGAWQLYKPAVYKWTWDRGRCGFMHPGGYRWSGSSVPRLARPFADPEVLWECSLPHDMGYETQGGLRPYRVWQPDETFEEMELIDWFTGTSFSEQPMSRGRIDALMFAFALASRVPVGMAEEAYVGVCIGGGPAWASEEPEV